jgi:hypothetical protein
MNSNAFSNGLPSCFAKQTQINKNNFDFILASLKNSLGNSESIKCICIDPIKSTSSLEKCWKKILDELVYSLPEYTNDSFIRFLNMSISSHHNLHTCSTKTALSFFILLWKRIKYTVDNNSLNSKLLSKYLKIIAEKAIDLCKQNHLEYLPLANIPLRLSQSYNGKVFSRHMKSLKINSILDLSANLEFYTELTNGISRDQTTVSKLLLDLLIEFENNNHEFNIDSLNIITAKNDSNLKENQDFNYEIFDGFFLSLDDNNVESLRAISSKLIKNKTLNCLFISGSLTQDHLHLGFNKNLNFTKYNLAKTNFTKSLNEWEQNVKRTLLNNQIEVLFIREKIEKNLREFCRINSLLVFANLSSTTEKKMKNFFKCPSLVYIEDFTNEHLFTVKLAKYEKDFIVLDLPDDGHLEKCFSILIKSRIQSTLLMHVEYLNHCIKRLSNILTNRHYLNGTNAEIEKSLSDSVKKFSDPSDRGGENEVYFELAKDVVANAFADFHLMVSANNSNDQLKIKFIDDFQSKSEAWHLSFYMCCIFLDSDISISI